MSIDFFSFLVLVAVPVVLFYMLRDWYRHRAITRRMEQYNKWMESIPTMNDEEKKQAQPWLHKCLFDPKFDYRGPWEKIKL